MFRKLINWERKCNFKRELTAFLLDASALFFNNALAIDMASVTNVTVK